VSRDVNKQKVYDAETLVFAETLYAEDMGGQVVELHEAILTSPWWRSEVGADVKLQPARHEANHSYARGHRLVRLAAHGQNAWTLAHELAHSAHSAIHRDITHQAHGPEWRRWYLDLATLVCGPAASARLAQSFGEAGLVIADPIAAPPTPPGEYGLYGFWRALQQAR
jgi:hypothetical protein